MTALRQQDIVLKANTVSLCNRLNKNLSVLVNFLFESLASCVVQPICVTKLLLIAKTEENLKPEDVRNRFSLHNHSKTRSLPSTNVQVLHDSFKRWRRCGWSFKGTTSSYASFRQISK